MLFRARHFEFSFPRPALVMGIVNVTPDSFSDGGKFFNVDAAVAHALELVAEGAEMLDVGGESTRPGADPVSEAEELRRVIPVIKKIAGKTKAVLSIDTMKPAVARAALGAGASIVNDVASSRNDSAMWQAVAEYRAGYICMHAPACGTGILPVQLHQPTGESGSRSQNPVDAVVVFFAGQLEKLNANGIASDQIILDPGIGFGKTLEQNLQLLAGLKFFGTFGRPLLLGVSRKSFIEKFSGAALNERLPASLACATLAIDDGVQIIRTHDVAETVKAVRIAEAVLSRKKNA